MDKRADSVKGWIETAVKYSTFVGGVIGVVFTMHARFVSMEHTLKSLKTSVDRLNVTCETLQQELVAEKTTTQLLTYRLTVLEKETSAPRLFKHETDH